MITWDQLTAQERAILMDVRDDWGDFAHIPTSELRKLEEVGLVEEQAVYYHFDSWYQYRRTLAGRALVESQQPAAHDDTEYTYDAPAETVDTLKARIATLVQINIQLQENIEAREKAEAVVMAEAAKIEALTPQLLAENARLRAALEEILMFKRYTFIDTPTRDVITVLQDQVKDMQAIAQTALKGDGE